MKKEELGSIGKLLGDKFNDMTKEEKNKEIDRVISASLASRGINEKTFENMVNDLVPKTKLKNMANDIVINEFKTNKSLNIEFTKATEEEIREMLIKKGFPEIAEKLISIREQRTDNSSKNKI